jgi:hypothetical protein
LAYQSALPVQKEHWLPMTISIMSSRHGSNWIDELCDALWQWIWCCRGIAKNIDSAPKSSKHILFSDSSFQASSDSQMEGTAQGKKPRIRLNLEGFLWFLTRKWTSQSA